MSKRFRPLSRRTLLKGAGATLALPMLDAMRPVTALAQEVTGPPVRFLTYYAPNGVHMQTWTPATEGRDYALTPSLAPLAAHKDDLLVLSGLRNLPARPDGPGDHAAGTGSFLTATHVFKTEGANIQNNISLDQRIANEIGGATPFASLELGAEGGSSVGNCDSGYSCAYSRNISWSGPATPVYKEVNPRAAFGRLFQGADPTETAESRARRRTFHLSVLDFVLEDARLLNAKLGRRDQAKVAEYMTGIRDLERRIEAAESGPQCTPGSRPDRPEGLPEHLRQMADIMTLALQCDSTRVITFMLGNAGSNRAHRFIDIREGHHEISHHQSDPENFRKLQIIDRWEMGEFAYLLDRLKATPEGDGTLLDNTVVLWSSEISDGNRHNHDNLPVLLAGGAGGQLDTGRHVRYADEPPIADLFIRIASLMGVPLDTFGDDGTTPLGRLTA